jgi:hypothetical protein
MTPAEPPPTDALRARFTEIYRNVGWSGGWPETVSGAGSTLESTAGFRVGLSDCLASGIFGREPTILDAPCGDFNWFREVRGYGRYVGMDIVEEMVAENTRRHGSDTVRFLAGDITRDALPAADVMLCRDALIHLPDALVWEALENFLRSGIPALLLTTHGVGDNAVLATAGGYRPINFGLAPFAFPAPLLQIPDDLGSHQKHVCLWTAAQVADVRRQKRGQLPFPEEKGT